MKAVYIELAQRGNEDGVRVILCHEENGEQYFQVHLNFFATLVSHLPHHYPL